MIKENGLSIIKQEDFIKIMRAFAYLDDEEYEFINRLALTYILKRTSDGKLFQYIPEVKIIEPVKRAAFNGLFSRFLGLILPPLSCGERCGHNLNRFHITCLWCRTRSRYGEKARLIPVDAQIIYFKDNPSRVKFRLRKLATELLEFLAQ
jgi:hypothetical protein